MQDKYKKSDELTRDTPSNILVFQLQLTKKAFLEEDLDDHRKEEEEMMMIERVSFQCKILKNLCT